MDYLNESSCPSLMEDLCCRTAAFCFLTRNYHTRMCKDLFLYWFEGIWMSFDSILNSANVERAYDGLLWTLRSLQELSSVLLLPNSMMEISSMSLSTLNEVSLSDTHTIVFSYDLVLGLGNKNGER
ncbi:putative non-specific serine/threonine protein kinase [Lupinus albus]|uniref:Putative non-specific serine/threonine protein kinase n=1 Tax=Lupinus albus TaxID=3870 RepID=A0A6A4Q3R9_LUPAL|nr:putative non-specific serine/threonine protein kinase [Lupinus albus]